jgi:hypothetical protein
MAVERVPAYEPATEVRVGRFEHDTEGHEAENIVVDQLAALGLPIERATVEQDEREGWDFRVGPIKVDVTFEQKKYERELAALEKVAKRGIFQPGEVVLPIKMPKMDPELIRSDPNTQRDLARVMWGRFLDEVKMRFPPGVSASVMRQIASLMNERQRQIG